MGSKGHVFYDHIVLVFIAASGFLYAAHGAARGSLLLTLAGGLGLTLTAYILLRAAFSAPLERLNLVWLERLDDALGEAVMGLFVLYVAGPLVFFVGKGLLTPFLENGFSEGLKVAAAMAVMLAAAWGFFAALSRFAWLRRAAVALVVFGLFFGAAAFFTGLFLADASWGVRGLYGVLAGEGLVCAGLSWAVTRGAGSDG